MNAETYRRKNLLSIRELTAGEISFLLDQTDSFREINERDVKKVPTLRGKTIVNLFFEDSTRTRASFEIAGKRPLRRRDQPLDFHELGEQGRKPCGIRPETLRRWPPTSSSFGIGRPVRPPIWAGSSGAPS